LTQRHNWKKVPPAHAQQVFVMSTPKTIDIKATNGNRNGTLKVIQRAMMIAKF
jgi:hypothetical protein